MAHSNNRIAVIDCGSNTFHLLIVDRVNSPLGFKEIYRERAFVYLSKSGISEISSSSYALGINTLERFVQIIKDYKVDSTRCLGTAVLRVATNGAKFISEAQENLDLDIELINGLEEAALIFKGISLSALPDGPLLILDIGGGSLELIHCDNNTAVSTTTVNAGISVLRSLRSDRDPLDESDLKILNHKLTTELDSFLLQISSYMPHTLVGASGSFEIIEMVNSCKPSPLGNYFDRDNVLEICSQICSLDLEGRRNLKGMPDNRADLSCESMTIIHFILEALSSIDKLLVSPFSLKEGVIKELLNLD